MLRLGFADARNLGGFGACAERPATDGWAGFSKSTALSPAIPGIFAAQKPAHCFLVFTLRSAKPMLAVKEGRAKRRGARPPSLRSPLLDEPPSRKELSSTYLFLLIKNPGNY